MTATSAQSLSWNGAITVEKRTVERSAERRRPTSPAASAEPTVTAATMSLGGSALAAAWLSLIGENGNKCSVYLYVTLTKKRKKNIFLDKLEGATCPASSIQQSLLFSKFKMASVMRLYNNGDRISAAVPLKSGSILQVYPVKREFATQDAWQKAWQESLTPKITLCVGAEGPAPTTPPRESKIPSLDDWIVHPRKNIVYRLPPGTYYIGDLCYVLKGDVMKNILAMSGFVTGVFVEKDTQRVIVHAGLNYGGEMYPGAEEQMYTPDKGLVGICSLSMMECDNGGGQLYTFDTAMMCFFIKGRFSFYSNHHGNYSLKDLSAAFGV